ncbi:phasin family protein [Vreelandella massiliensis]|uniref:phasin family protein n=1 Tax=Vreelandella massiliensis TaxID=1816686 RepID=UPI00096A5AF4|nr:phasin family protein [Halomonas massiliensis]MYL23057.1 phasin family protein [Halomonas alkaliantarctica]
MTKAAEKTSQELNTIFVNPMRSYATAALDYYDQVVGAQIDAARAYSDMSVAQMRTWLDVNDADSLKKAVDRQQKTASDMLERFKGDAEKLTTLGQTFMQESQKMAEQNMQNATDATQKAANEVTQKIVKQ